MKKENGKKKHILVVSQYFYPEQFRINDMCQEWIKRGYKVTVLTGIPNYPQGKFYTGYGYIKKRQETWEGINVIRIPLIPRGKNALGLVLNYFSFLVSGFFWNLVTNVDADYVFIFGISPLTQALIGTRYAKRHSIPCCLYVQDLWPENVESVTGIHNEFVLRPIGKMMNSIYRDCSILFATSESMVKKIQERVFENKDKILFWPQYSEEFYDILPKCTLPDMKENESYKIIYTGNIGYAQGLEILPKIARKLKNAAVRCEFYIIGDGRYKETLYLDIKNRDVEDMFFLLGKKQPEEIPKYMAVCDAAFLSFADEPIYEMTIPAKLQSYMACGMPILAVAKGETKRIIERAECGIAIENSDIDQVFLAIQNMVKDASLKKEIHGKRAREYCEIHFNKRKLMDYFDDVIKNQEKIHD